MNESKPDLQSQLIQRGVINYRGDQALDFESAKQIASEIWLSDESNIWVAASCGNKEAIVSLLEKNPSLVHETGGPFDWTPILYLCYSRIRHEQQDWIGSLEALLAKGADANDHFWFSETYKFTCLTGVIGEGEAGPRMWPPHPEAHSLAQILLDAGADPNDSQGLYNSLFSGGTHWIELLLKHNWQPEDRINWVSDQDLSTMDFVFSYACKKNQMDRVKILLDAGANPEVDDYYDSGTAMYHATMRGNHEVVELLSEAGVKQFLPESPKEKFLLAVVNLDRSTIDELKRSTSVAEFEEWLIAGSAALNEQVELNRAAVVSLMLELGFPIGQSLFTAAWNGHFQMARLLLDHGASVRQRDPNHLVTPIAFANRTGYRDLRDFLLTKDADVFDVITYGTAVRLEEILIADPYALERNFSEYVSDCPEMAAVTPLTHAVMCGRTEHAELLIQLGADLQVRHPDGRNLAQIARQVAQEIL